MAYEFCMGCGWYMLPQDEPEKYVYCLSCRRRFQRRDELAKKE